MNRSIDKEVDDIVRSAYACPENGGPRLESLLRDLASDQLERKPRSTRVTLKWIVASFAAVALGITAGSRLGHSSPHFSRDRYFLFKNSIKVEDFTNGQSTYTVVYYNNPAPSTLVRIARKVMNIVGFGEHDLRLPDGTLVGNATVLGAPPPEEELPSCLSQEEFASQDLMLTYDGSFAMRTGTGYAMGADKPVGLFWKVHGPATVNVSGGTGGSSEWSSTAIHPSLLSQMGLIRWSESSPAVPILEWRIGVKWGRVQGYGVYPIKNDAGKVVTTLKLSPLKA